MFISLQALRDDDKRRQQNEQRRQAAASQFCKFPWQKEPEPPVGVLKFIRSMAQR